MTPNDKERRMQHWLGLTLRGLREHNGLAMDDIRLYLRDRGLRTSESTLSRLETGQTLSKHLDEIIVGYGERCAGVEDPREIWKLALNAYLREGGIPLLGDVTEQQAAVIAALEAHTRQRHQQEQRTLARLQPPTQPADDESPEAPPAKDKRKKAR